MPRNGKARRSRSASPIHDEESDYQAALRLSAELNSGQNPLSSKISDAAFESDADFAYALKVQFEDSNGTSSSGGEASRSHSNPTRRGSEVPPWALKENDDKVAIYHTETPGGKTFKSLTKLTQHVQSAQCFSCRNLFFKSELDVSAMLQKWRSGKAPLTSSLKCSRCSQTSCIACTPQAYAKESVVAAQGKRVSWCCAGGRLFLLWLLLCDVDEHFSKVKAEEMKQSQMRQRSQTKSGKIKKSNKQARGGGVGFGGPPRYPVPTMGPMPSGLGFGGDHMEDYDDYNTWGPGQTLSGHHFDTNASSTGSKAKVLSAQNQEDLSNTLHLELVEALLPSFERDSGFDFDPPEAVTEMLLQSKILHYCAELLRNDSLDDATKRKGVYQALINFIRTLGAHYATATCAIYDERPCREDKVNLLELCWQRHPQPAKVKNASLFSCLGNLSTQSELVIQEAKKNEAEFRMYDGQNLLLLCHQISELQSYLSANARTGDAKSTQSELIPALTDLPDRVILETHKFGTSAISVSSAPTGRFKRLITEITTLKTGLPPGIFVRYAESRPDVQKVLIVGPAGTPYENGLFEFDVFCDASFPNKPPLMDFKTTGGGRVGFNPNLYADGKVCLSLLGTWQGEPWVPNESTLLQIVISIQAMILCEEPWYNEPGRETTYSSGSSVSGPAASYNQTIRQHTVRTAILGWLDKTPPLWKDVVDQHFKTNANKILKTAVEWSRSKIEPLPHAGPFGDNFSEDFYPGPPGGPPTLPGARSSAPQQSNISQMLQQLQKALNNYGADKIVPDEPEPVPVKRESSRLRRYLSPYSSQPSPYTPPPSLPQSPYTPLMPFATPTPLPDFFGSGGFGGPGRVLGEAPADVPNAASSGRGGTGRYETRSSTRGHGGPSVATPPGSSSAYGRGGASATATPGDEPMSDYDMYHPWPSGRGGRGNYGGRGGTVVQAYPGGPNLWPFDPPGHGGRGGGRGNPSNDRGHGARGGRGGRGGLS